MRRGFGVLAAIVLSFAATSPAAAADPLMVNGAGATFPYPLYSSGSSSIPTPTRA